jgi:hypothetical protein
MAERAVARDAKMADGRSSLGLPLPILELLHNEEGNHLLRIIIEERIPDIKIVRRT